MIKEAKEYIKVFKINHPVYFYLMMTYVFILLIYASSKLGTAQRYIGNDYFVFWDAGRTFLNDLPLYESKKFLYPPFAAMLFQVLNIFDFELSSAFFSFINGLLYIYSLFLIHYFIKNSGLNEINIKWTFIIVMVISYNFVQINLNLGQVNLLILVMILQALYFVNQAKIYRAIALLAIATMIKITPIIFLAYVVARKLRIKTILYTSGLLLLFIFLPLCFRGLDQTLLDYQEYFIFFIDKYLIEGANFTSHYANQNLYAAMSRLLAFEYPNHVEILAKVIKLLFAVSIVFIFFKSMKKKEAMVLEIALLFLFTNIMSSVTWKAHLITLMFIYIPFILYFLKNKTSLVLLFIASQIIFITIAPAFGQEFRNWVDINNFHLYILVELYIFYYLLYTKNVSLA